MLRALWLVALGAVSSLPAADLSGTWVGALQTEGGHDPVCLSLLQNGRAVKGDIAHQGDTKYAPIEKVGESQIAFEVTDKDLGTIHFLLTTAINAMTGEVTVQNRVETVALKENSPPKAAYQFGPAPSGSILIRATQPEYTEQARAAKVQGTVGLKVDILSSGDVGANIEVFRGLGSGLDEKAIECVRKWKFSPPRWDCQPGKSRVTVEVNFRLLQTQ
jgi:TonB family protein